MKIYTKHSISKLKRGTGWFYGIVQEDSKHYVIAEIFPGAGYGALVGMIHTDGLKHAKQIFKDILWQLDDRKWVKKK